MIGREEDLSRLQDFLDGAGGVVVLEGDAGIGKTTLWRAGVDRAREQDFTVLEARPAAAERELSFAALGDLFADARDEISALPAPQRRALRIALALEEAEGEPPEQRTIAVAVTELLRGLAERGHLLLALDDVQWVDGPSGAALEFALRRLPGIPIHVLAARRRGGESAIGFDDLELLSVGPLPLEGLGRLVRERLGAKFLLPVLRQLHAVSGGNPFYGLELASGLLRSGRRIEPGEQLPIPTHLREVVRARLATITPQAREAAFVTAALAQASLQTVRAALSDGEDAVARAVEAGVLEIDGDELRFTHPLFAAAVYDDAPATERKAIHARLAQVVHEPEERARHLAEAAERPDATVAAFVEAAAASVAARGAPDAAVRLAKLAVDLTPSNRRHVLHKRRLDCARYSFAAGDPKHAEALLDSLVEWSRPGRERALAYFELGHVRREIEGLTAATACYERALEELRDGDELELQTRILVELAVMLIADPTYLADAGRTPDVSDRALALAEWLGNPDLLARAIGIHALRLTLEGQPPPGELWRRGIELEESTGRLRYDGPTSLYCYAAFLRGDLKGASDHLARVTASMRSRGDPMLAKALLDLCESLRIAGDWDHAARCADEAHDIVIQTGRDPLEPLCLLAKARLAIPRGDVDRATRCAAAAMAAIGSSLPERWRIDMEGLVHSVRGQIAQTQGEHANAHEEFLVAIDSARKFGKPAQHMLAELIAGDVESLLALGRFDAASEQLDRLRELVENLGFPTLDAILARTDGLVAAARGDHAEALTALERAVRTFDDLLQPWPFQLARSLLALGTAQRLAQQKRAARTTLTRALELFDTLGARPWSERAQTELGLISGRPTRPDALTASEARVAELVAAGRSNAEVARELFMSPKTVEWNLSKIYRKLHVRSRAELAAKLAREPLSA